MRQMALVSLLCLAVAGTAKGEGGWTPLHDAALVGDVAAIEVLLAAGANINAKAENDITPLHVAAAERQIGSIKALLDAGANVNAKGALGTGSTARHIAAKYGQVPAIEALLAAGANVNAKAENEVTPLHLARYGMERTEGSIAPFQEAIEILTAHGAR